MRLATRTMVVLLALGFVAVAALLLASAAIGAADPRPARSSSAGAQPDPDSWRTDDSVLDGIPVAVGLADDFARAWFEMTGLRWYQVALPLLLLVALTAVARHAVHRLRRRHGNRPLPV